MFFGFSVYVSGGGLSKFVLVAWSSGVFLRFVGRCFFRRERFLIRSCFLCFSLLCGFVDYSVIVYREFL